MMPTGLHSFKISLCLSAQEHLPWTFVSCYVCLCFKLLKLNFVFIIFLKIVCLFFWSWKWKFEKKSLVYDKHFFWVFKKGLSYFRDYNRSNIRKCMKAYSCNRWWNNKFFNWKITKCKTSNWLKFRIRFNYDICFSFPSNKVFQNRSNIFTFGKKKCQMILGYLLLPALL